MPAAGANKAIEDRAIENKAAVIEGILQRYHEAKLFNGSATVLFDGATLVSKGFGYADLSGEHPITENTRFFIGSNSKQFTAAVIFRLISDGLLELDGKVSAYLPYFRKDVGDRVAIHQLLTHTSGIFNYTEASGFDPLRSFSGLSPQEVVREFSLLPLMFEPGSQFKYSNTNYYILGGIIEQLLDKPFCDVLEEYVIAPLGLRNTGFYSGHWDTWLFAKAYDAGTEGFQEISIPPAHVFFSSGNVYSSCADMTKWINRLISGDVIPKGYKHVAFEPVFNHYACGVATVEAGAGEMGKLLGDPLHFVPEDIWRDGKTYRFYLHRGAAVGYNAFWIASPELGITVVLLNSFRNDTFLEEIIYRIMKVLL